MCLEQLVSTLGFPHGQPSFDYRQFPCIDDVFEEIDGHPEYLITFQIPLPCNQEVVQYYLEDRPFQRKDLDSSIIAPLYNEFIQQFIDSLFVIATDASKSPFITAIAGCTATSQFSYRIHTVNSIFIAEVLAIGTVLDELCLLKRTSILLTDSLSVLKAL